MTTTGQLAEELNLVWRERKVFAGIETQPLRISLLDQTDSTMNAAKLGGLPVQIRAEIPAWPMTAAEDGVGIVLALEQSAGRGRHDRRWVSNPGKGIYLTAAFRALAGAGQIDGSNQAAAAPLERLPQLSLAAGLAAANTVRSAGAEGVLKWPNDVLIPCGGSYRKIAGVIVESSSAAPGSIAVLVGIGLNFAADQEAAAAGGISLEETADRPIRYGEAAAALIDQLLREISEFFIRYSDGPGKLTARWQELSMMDGKAVKFVQDGIELRGISRGIDPSGALQVETGDQIRKIISGEVLIADATGV